MSGTFIVLKYFLFETPLIFIIIGIIAVIVFGRFIIEDIIEARRRKEDREKLSQSGIYDVDRMDGIEFEMYLEVLFEKIGFKTERTQASNDYGADLVLEGQERIVIQAKRYKSTVGIKAVQEISSARAFYNATGAWVVTNNYFTTPAMRLAQSTGVRLIDRDELVDLILSSQNSRVNRNRG